MANDIAIKVEHLSKYYKLGVINNGTLFRDIQSWMARKRGKEDPHAKIGSIFDPTEEGFWALKDLNFEIKKGDRVGIIGHNGAGKSTVLKILSQITAPTEGSLKINGKISSLLEVGTGFHGELTGRENIFMNGAILGMKHSEIDSKIADIIEFSEIGDYIDTPVKRYSSGMYVRLAFAVAAHLNSDILIADEVLAVGDAAFQKKALGKMNELSTGEGRTVLFVSHNMAQVKALCNRGIVLEKGRVVLQDAIDLCIENYLIKNTQVSENLEQSKTFELIEEKSFQVKNVSVQTENGIVLNAYESQLPIILKMTYISRTPLSGLYGYYSIQNVVENKPTLVFDSREKSESSLYDLNPGEYNFEICIPAGVLAPGKYNFYANFTHNGNDIDSPLNCISFMVVDTFTERGKGRGAITSVIPDMKLTKL